MIAVCPSPKSQRLKSHVEGEGVSENGGVVFKVTVKGARPVAGEAVAVAGQPPRLLMPHCALANIAAHRQKKTRAGSFTNRSMPQKRTIHLAKRVIKQNSIRLG